MSDNKITSCDDLVEHSVLSVEQAQQNILGSCSAITRLESVKIEDAQSRVLVNNISSSIDVPGHTNSAMDGYAIAGADLPESGSKQFQLLGKSLAGNSFTGTLSKNSCVRVTTGAVMPAGSDTVIMQEHVHVTDDRVEIDDHHRAGQHVRLAGNDIAKNTLVLEKGRCLTAADLGILASIGLQHIDVYHRPKVCFFSSGDELKVPGEALAHGEIYNSSRYSIGALVQQAGAELISADILPDQPDVMRTAFVKAAQEADIIITTGGVSVGEADYIKDILAELGEVGFWKIAMKPGRPLAFGKIKNCLFFGLPGNPVSSMATFMQLVRPAIYAVAGMQPLPQAIRIQARLLDEIKKRPGRMDFQRGILTFTNGQCEVSTTGTQSSGQLRSMSIANCFIVLAAETGDIAAGQMVEVEPFSQELQAAI